MAKLVYSDGGTEQEFVLDAGRAAYTIGRNPMCDLRINNPSMSRKHAEIRLDASSGRYSLHDLNSSNGTFVNGRRMQQCELSDGDTLLCGEFELRFDDRAAAAPPPPPSVPIPSAPAPPPPPSGGGKRNTIAGMPAELLANSGEARRLSEEIPAIPAPPPPPSPNRPEPTTVSTTGAVPVAPDGDAESVARDLRAARAELKSLRLALQNESSRAADAVEQKSRAEKAVERLESELAEVRESSGAAARLESDVADLRQRNEVLEEQIAALTERAELAETRLREKTEDAARFEGELELLRAQLEEAPDADEVQALRTRNEAMKDAFRDLSNELQELIAANRELMATTDDTE